MTNGEIIDAALKAMGFTHDDALMHRASMGHSLGVIINRLKRQRLEKELRSPAGSRGSTGEVTTYPLVPIAYEASLSNRAYFELPPAEVVDLKVNGGIAYIAYAGGSGCRDGLLGKHFSQTSPTEINFLQGHGMLRPAPENPYYYRARISTATGIVTNRVWLYGLGATVTGVEVGLYLSAPSIDNMDPDAEVELPSDLIYIAERLLLDTGRATLLVPGQRLKNDGREFAPYTGAQPFQPPKEMSVNDPVNLTTD